MALGGGLVDTTEGLEKYRSGWDALAVATRRPYCAPAWMLAWWRHVAHVHAALRVVVVLEGEELVAVAPFFAERRPGRPTVYRILAAGTSHRVEPVVRRGAEAEAARVIAGTIANAEPRPAVISFDSVDTRVRWPAILGESWPVGPRPWSVREWSGPAPTVTLEGLTFEAWMQMKSRNFRSQERRLRRRLEARGARFRLTSTEQELERDLREFARLHYARMRKRGGSLALDASVERMLADAGRELLGSGRFRLLSIEADGQTISSHLFLAAGGEVSYWNGGFDEGWAAEQPSMRALVAAIEDAFGRSDRRFDLGGGAESYKYRLADGGDTVETTLVVPRGQGYAVTRLQLAPKGLRRALAARLSEGARVRLRRARRGRLPGGD